jgi:hypothetical protein
MANNNQLENTETFRRSITSADGTGIIEILNCADSFLEYANLANTHYLGKGFYLEALSGAIYLPSYEQASFAEIFPEMSGDQKIAALLKIEEEYPFIGLRFHAKKGSSGAWSTLATARLQNKGRETTIPFVIPFLTINQLKVLGPTDRLGLSIMNYGHGVLNPGDYINIEGDYRYVLDLIEKPQVKTIGAALPYGVDIGTAIPTRFRLANANRAILYATNTGNTPVWVAGNASVSIGSGLFLAPNGNGNLTEEVLTGELWAIAEGSNSRICGIEASYG